MAAQQQQLPAAQRKQRRRDPGLAPEGGPQQAWVIVVARQQGRRHCPRFQQLPQAHVATQALVLAEITSDQEQIRGVTQLQERLVPSVLQRIQGHSAATASTGIRQQVGITQLQHPQHHLPLGHRPKLPVPRMAGMAAIPPGTRQRCSLCQVEIQGMAGGADLVHFSQGGPSTRSKLWARVCQYLRTDEQKAQCLNQDPTLRGEQKPGDAYMEPPAVDLNALGGPLGG